MKHMGYKRSPRGIDKEDLPKPLPVRMWRGLKKGAKNSVGSSAKFGKFLIGPKPAKHLKTALIYGITYAVVMFGGRYIADYPGNVYEAFRKGAGVKTEQVGEAVRRHGDQKTLIFKINEPGEGIVTYNLLLDGISAQEKQWFLKNLPPKNEVVGEVKISETAGEGTSIRLIEKPTEEMTLKGAKGKFWKDYLNWSKYAVPGYALIIYLINSIGTSIRERRKRR